VGVATLIILLQERAMAFVLQLHNIWRWVLLVAAIVVLIKALVGWLGRRPFTKLDDQLGMAFTIIVDVQVLLGLIIWLFGPLGLQTLSQSMGNAALRFIVLEHPILMLIALAFAHVGRARSKKAADDTAKHRISFIFYLLSFIFIALIFLMPMMMG
jgi:hypothetical protein